MTDIRCVLAGMTRLLSPPLLLLFWHKRTRARLYPALIAFGVCFPVFIIGAAIRSGFSHSNFVSYYLGQAVLYGILEEGAKYLVLRFALDSYDSRKDAVTYAIGHGAYEEFAAGLTCLGLIGTNRAAAGIFWFSLWATIDGAAFVIANTVLIFYGINTDRAKIMLPAAILLHAAANASQGILTEPAAIAFQTLLTAGACFAAYRCYQAMQNPYEDESFDP